jgi:hypothetical protein
MRGYSPLGAQWAPKKVAVKISRGRAISRKGSNLAVRESSETARQTVPVITERMIQSDLHGDMQSAAEMTAPDEKSSSNNNERS